MAQLLPAIELAIAIAIDPLMVTRPAPAEPDNARESSEVVPTTTPVDDLVVRGGEDSARPALVIPVAKPANDLRLGAGVHLAQGTAHKRRELFQPEVAELDLDAVMPVREVLRRLRGLTTNRIGEAAVVEEAGVRYRVQVRVEPDPPDAPRPRRSTGL